MVVLVSAKAAGSAPASLTLEMLMGVPLGLPTVMVWGALVLPTASLPQFTVFGKRKITGRLHGNGIATSIGHGQVGAAIRFRSAAAIPTGKSPALSYLLKYNRQPAAPPINLVKSNASQTSFPNTEDCRTISLH